MSAFNKYQQFVEDLGDKVHDLVGTNDTLKIALTNTAPDAAAHAVLTDIAELAAGNGYPAGGIDTENVGTETDGILTVAGVDVVFTASGGNLGPFRYAVLYNDTPASPEDPLIGWWDYGSAVTLQSGQIFTVDVGASLFTIE